jgi:hypothetical protein
MSVQSQLTFRRTYIAYIFRAEELAKQETSMEQAAFIAEDGYMFLRNVG